MRCLVIGGARRLGAALALEMARAGADVAVSSRTPAAAAGVVAQIEALGRRAVAVGGDVEVRLEARHVVRAAAAALDGLDLVLFAASGPFHPTSPEDLDDAVWGSSMDVIARGFLYCAQAAREVFLESAAADTSRLDRSADRAGEAESQTGTIVALTDIIEGHPWPRLAHHYAAKAAQISLVRLLAAAWAGDGVRVCGVAPGPVDLPDDDRRDATERAARRLGYTRLLSPAEVAATVLSCVSDPASSGENRVVHIE